MKVFARSLEDSPFIIRFKTTFSKNPDLNPPDSLEDSPFIIRFKTKT